MTTLLALSLAFSQASDAEPPDFGDDSSTWSNDGECDDPRFAGPGMTQTTLLDSDRFADATDCRTAYERGDLWLVDKPPSGAATGFSDGSGPDFGNDSSRWSNDGECDDPRFQGPGMTPTTLLDSDRFADATDCKTAFDAGQIWLANSASTLPTPDFGNDSSEWANDGECDDPRFAGPGMTLTTLLDSDRFADATDCREAWERGQLRLR